MKALSLTQPWATAIAVGQKQFETRSWSTISFCGEVCIHAAKGFPKYAREFAAEEAEFNDDSICTVDWDEGRGAILCVANLVERYPAEILTPSRLESHWGDFSIGRFAFKLENVRVLKLPVPATDILAFGLSRGMRPMR